MSATTTAPAPAKSAFTMTVPPKGGDGEYELCPAGNYPATMIALIDLGTHTKDFKGKAETSRKIALAFELSGEIKGDGTPFVVAERYTMSLNESSNYRKLLKGWRGRDFAEGEEFDPMVLLGRPCLVSIVHKVNADGKTYHNLGSVSNVVKGMSVPTPHHETFAYHLSDGPYPDPDWLPSIYGKSVADLIAESHERQGTSPPAGNPKAASNGASANGAPARPMPDPADVDSRGSALLSVDRNIVNAPGSTSWPCCSETPAPSS